MIQRLVPSAAAVRPSRVAAYFQVTCGRPSRTEVSQAALTASASSARRPCSTCDAGRAQGVGAAGGLGVRVADGVEDAGDAGLDERLGAGAGAAGVVAGFEGDVRGAAAGPLACGFEGVDLGVRAAGPLVEALADDRARRRR